MFPLTCHPGHDPECSILVFYVSEILSHTPGFRVFASLNGMTMKQEYEVSSLPVKILQSTHQFAGRA